MRRRLRFRRLLKWIGTVASVLIVVGAAVTSLAWRRITFGDRHWFVGIETGALVATWTASPLSYEPGLRVDRPLGTWREVAAKWSLLGCWPTYGRYLNVRGAIVFVPLWIPFVVFAIPTALLWRLDRRRFPPGHCAQCGYNLIGNTSGRCPECGEPFADQLKPPPRAGA